MLGCCNRVGGRLQEGHSFLRLSVQGSGATPEFLLQSRSQPILHRRTYCKLGSTANPLEVVAPRKPYFTSQDRGR